MFSRALVLIVVAGSAGAGCATPRTICPLGTDLARQVFSGGAEAEWCVRPDGARQGPETRFYESGAELASGTYVDGAQSGVWRYRFNDGRNWRAERWEDGALLQTTIDPAVARMSPAEMEALGPTTSGIIKLASHDPIPGRETREATGGSFISHFPNGRPHVAGSYDRAGLRVGPWRTWFEDGKPALEMEYLGGLRDGGARAWHPNGAPAAEGRYLAGAREGSWRFWDDRGQPTGEVFYRNGAPIGPAAGSPGPGGMLAPKP